MAETTLNINVNEKSKCYLYVQCTTLNRCLITSKLYVQGLQAAQELSHQVITKELNAF